MRIILHTFLVYRAIFQGRPGFLPLRRGGGLGQEVTWIFSIPGWGSRFVSSLVYILKMNFHITDLFHLFHHIEMYFVFVMQSNFDAINAGIFYAYFLRIYLNELIN